jgi:TolB-like protein/Flp pilus assembly protein TadD
MLLLTALAKSPGEILSKADLMRAAWPGVTVEDSNLTVQIAKLRQVLGTGPDGAEWITTVPRLGYRFTATVESLDGVTTAGDGRPSVAVLPFENLSGKPAQAYAADAITDEVITGLARFSNLDVAARNSSFAYKGTAVDVRQVAKQLGVRYVLEGSVRSTRKRLRVAGRLIDGTAGTHIWADRFESEIDGAFETQDRLTDGIVGAVELSVRRAEILRAARKRPDSREANDLFLRALPQVYANKPGGTEVALHLLGQALEAEPDHSLARACASWCHEQRYFRAGFRSEDKTAALEYARASITSGDPQAMSIGAFVQANITRDFDTAAGILERALSLNGNSALALGFSALVNAQGENYDRAETDALRALRLSPFDPLNYHAYGALALVYLFTGRFEQAVAFSGLAVQSNPGFSVFHALLVSSSGLADRADASSSAARRLLEVAPDFSIAAFVRMGVYPRRSMEQIAEALYQAGLPE